jgi:hypothetical protein
MKQLFVKHSVGLTPPTAQFYQPPPRPKTQTDKAFLLYRSATLCPSYPNTPGETNEGKEGCVCRIARPPANDLLVYKTPSNKLRQDVGLFYNPISPIVFQFPYSRLLKLAGAKPAPATN